MVLEIMVATTNDASVARILGVSGSVYGTSMRSRSIVGNALSGPCALFGGARPLCSTAGFRMLATPTPEHMRSEYNSYMYDTGCKIPCAPIRRLAATAVTCLRPPSDSNAFLNARMESIAFSLPETQHRITTDGTIAWGTQVVAGKNAGAYLPPN